MDKVNIAEKLAKFSDHWHPRIVGELNGQHVKLAKLKGEFIWHQHDDEDEMFFVIKGQLKMVMRNETVIINPNEFYIVPKGVEHKPIAEEEVSVMLFEPKSTKHTGDEKHALTKETLEWI